MRANHRRRGPVSTRSAAVFVSALLGIVVCGSAALRAQIQSPEEIQRQREEAERRRIEYLDQKRKVDHINARVRQYKKLMDSVPFTLVPGTSNMVQVYVNGHDIHDVAQRLYFVSDGATESGFSSFYWPLVLFLNQASTYDGGMPRYGKLDPQRSENNVAVFPNVRKQGDVAVVAQITGADSALALQLTSPVVAAYRQRLQEEVERLAALGGDVELLPGPSRMPDEAQRDPYRPVQTEPKPEYPPRRIVTAGSSTQLASTDPVPVDRSAPLEPAPPAWSLRQGVNMLGPSYEGYNMQYAPDHLDLSPEVGPVAFLGGRDSFGMPHTQPGMLFGLSQRAFKFLLLNESALVVFSTAGAPAVNGVNLSTGLDFDVLGINLSGMVGLTSLRVVGETVTGPSFAGKLRMPITEHLYLGGLFRVTNLEKFRVDEVDATGTRVRRTGVTRASYAGISLTLR